jgi:hypothetical protein
LHDRLLMGGSAAEGSIGPVACSEFGRAPKYFHNFVFHGQLHRENDAQVRVSDALKISVDMMRKQ